MLTKKFESPFIFRFAQALANTNILDKTSSRTEYFPFYDVKSESLFIRMNDKNILAIESDFIGDEGTGSIFTKADGDPTKDESETSEVA